MSSWTIGRRGVLGGLGAVLAGGAVPALARAAEGAVGGAAGGAVAPADPETAAEIAREGYARNNISSFRRLDWRDHFPTLAHGAILADTVSRAVHYWSADGSTYRLWPSSVPISEELTRRGMTEVVRKVVGPTWRPTPSMRERNPALPAVVGPGPDNPLGTHALYLSWQYYRVHGTHDTRKIGRRSSDGCIGLYNDDIAELFEMAEVGTQVRLL